MGRVNQDCWYLYTLNPPISDGVRGGLGASDQTFEMIMQNLDQKVMKIFTREVCSSAKEATQKSGIDKIFPGMQIDDFLFTPCGYSMNGLLKGGYYITIHITPEPLFSYVSFETNAPQSSYQDLINRLLKIFIPGKFILTIFANEVSFFLKLFLMTLFICCFVISFLLRLIHIKICELLNSVVFNAKNCNFADSKIMI